MTRSRAAEWRSGKAKPVRSRLAADFTGWDLDAQKFEAQVENVSKTLRADDDGRAKPSEPKLLGGRGPSTALSAVAASE